MGDDAKEVRSLRLSCLSNAGDVDGATVLIQSDESFTELLKKANTALCKEGEDSVYVKAFLQTGSEVKTMDVIRDNDVLVFAKEGERFRRWAVAAGSAGVLQSMANTAVALSGDLYSTYVPKVKEAVPFVAKPIDAVEEFAGVLEPHVREYAQGYGVPALQWADRNLQMVYHGLQQRQERFLASDLGQKANEILVERTYRPVEAFLTQAVANWKEQREAGNLTMEHFVSTLKTKMGSAWSERLVQPAESFFHAIQEESKLLLEKQEGMGQIGSLLTNVKARLGPAWERAVAEADARLPARIKAPAGAFYQAAVESFVALQMSAQEKQVTVQEFVAGVRVKLGGLWEQNLAPITAQLFEVLHLQHKQGMEQAQAQAEGGNGDAVAMENVPA